MKLLMAIFFIGVIPGFLFYFIIAPLTNDEKELGTSLTWTIIGTGISYYSLLFSLYAVLEVRKITNKYLFKIRSPEIHKKTLALAKNMNRHSGEKHVVFRSAAFLSEIPVTVRAAKRLRNKDIIQVANKFDQPYNHLKKNASQERNENATAGQIEGYWEVLHLLFELTDEIKTQIDEVKAAQ